MNIIEQLESLRIHDSDFFGISTEQQHIYAGKNEMLDDCLEVVLQWLREHSAVINMLGENSKDPLK